MSPREIDYLEAILNANVYDVAIESPLQEAPLLSARLGNRLLLKREDLQPVFSFKLRGAYNKMSRLPPAELRRGVVAASAGNHAQGVALAAQRLGAAATIVMPVTTPQIKVGAVRALGAEVVLEGDSYDDAYEAAMRLVRRGRRTFVHPYDDPDVIAGQGTIAMELLRQFREPLDAVFVAVGGGGLIAGIAAYVKRLRPQTRIVGVEPVDANAMERSLRAGRRVTLAHVGLFADGVAVRRVGEEPFRIARRHVDEVILVDTDEICAAMKDVFEDTRAIVEPSAALGVAGAKRYVEREQIGGRNLATILCGANVNFDRLRFVAERAELGEQREAVFAATIPERPGSFKAFCSMVGRRSITEFNYRYDDASEAHVFVGVEVQDVAEKDKLLASLAKRGIRTLDLTENEMAKLHVRHLVGGRSHAEHEVLYRFEFPERPGALMRFLDAIGNTWNISLFHYRNHGADYGRVLAGIQVPPGEKRAFKAFLEQLGYPYWEETRNPAADLFLQA
ncbi:threonine ammonia-lyase, biosynthetic [Gaiella occulta]|uniref:L-threonine dehydratase n=1 Tax=Gaiella occulta TaxID=1002870 RepID=A0A7M2YXB3_9ACTN|nr:threonine ammonia-lyase, biosynthetic [Gaiella occulta]RDI74514.1 threonine ammonia-lyase, biosynthetic [Gaiella occulta]